MSFYIKGNALNFRAPEVEAKISVDGDDLIFSIKRTDGALQNISLIELLNRVNHLEKSLAEMILLGDNKNG